MSSQCEWCAKHRETLRKMEDDFIAVERGANALELMVGAGEFDPSDAIKFISSQLVIIAGRVNESFSQMWLHQPLEGEEKS